MSNSAKASAIEIEVETLFCEATPTTTATLRLPIIGPVDTGGLKRPKIDSGRAQQHRNAGSKHIDAAFSGEIKTKFWWFGHGSSTSAVTTRTAFETFLGNIIGAVQESIASGTTFTAGGSATVPTTTVVSGFARGSIGFAGVLGDGRGNGQAFAVADHAASSLPLLTGLDAAPNAGDLCRSAVVWHPNELPTNTTLPSYRMRLLTANQRYLCRGVFPTAIAISGLNAGERPTIEVTWSVAHFVELDAVTGVFPSVVATDSSNPATVAGGTVFLQDVGVATRNAGAKFSVRNFTIDYTLGVETLRGPGGNFHGQDIVGARRTNDDIKVKFVIDADAATTAPVLKTIFESSIAKHILYTGSTANGSSIAIYMPRVEPCGEYPVQQIDNGMLRYSFEGYAYTGSTTTTELTSSAIRFANG